MAKTNTEKNPAEESVTISKAQLDALMADMALLKQQLASEDRQREIKNRQLAKEEEERKRVQKANAAAMELVPLHVELGSVRSNKTLEVSINGKQYLIPKGETVMVPRCVKDVVDSAEEQQSVAYGLQKKRKKEFEDNMKALGLSE